MPKPSAFCPAGHLRCSSKKSYGELIYKAMIADVAKAFDTTKGTFVEATTYADAMMLARAQYALDRAGNQAHGATAYDLLPVLEEQYEIVPLPSDTIPERQAAVALAQIPLRGARLESLVDGLRQRIGANLLAVAPVSKLTTPTVIPSSPGSGQGNWIDPRTPPQYLQLIDPVLTTGTPIWVAYQSLDTSDAVTNVWQASTAYPAGANVIPTDATETGLFYLGTAGTSGTTEPVWPAAVGGSVSDGGITWTAVAFTAPPLSVGQTVTVQGENTMCAERVTVTGFATSPPAGSFASPGLCFQATFTKAHDTGASIVTGPFPYWWSTQRQLLLILAGTSSGDPKTRKVVNAWMARATRGVDQWAIVQPTTETPTGGTVGPLSVGSPMGCVPFGSLTFTNTP
jgi:hypothetical protein